MEYNVLTFTGKNEEVYKISKDKFDDRNEAKKFIKESNSEYDKDKKHWSISILSDFITEIELYRKELEEWL